MKKIEEIKLGDEYFYVVYESPLEDETTLTPFAKLADAVQHCKDHNEKYDIIRSNK
jgi:hypothetical protein